MSFLEKAEAYKRPRSKGRYLGITVTEEFDQRLDAAVAKIGIKRTQFLQAALEAAVEESENHKPAARPASGRKTARVEEPSQEPDQPADSDGGVDDVFGVVSS